MYELTLWITIHLHCLKGQISYYSAVFSTMIMICERIHLHGVVTCSPTGSVMRLTPVIFVSLSGIFSNPFGWHHLLGSCSQTDNSTTQSMQIQGLSSHSLEPADLQGKMCQIYSPPPPPQPPPLTTNHQPTPLFLPLLKARLHHPRRPHFSDASEASRWLRDLRVGRGVGVAVMEKEK